MSNDLISRKEAIETLKNVFDKYGVSWGEKYGGFAKAIPNAIEDLPTAYDVDKVAEQMKAESWSVGCAFASEEQRTKIIQTERAIEIVKGEHTWRKD